MVYDEDVYWGFLCFELEAELLLDCVEEAGSRFVQPLLDQLGKGGLGHLPEIADGDPPHEARGCPWQAWSLGELLRVLRLVGEG